MTLILSYRNKQTEKFTKSKQPALALIERYFQDSISLDAYLSMCEQLGKEPNPDEMPPSLEDFPLEIQEAFIIHSMLPDRWDGSSGSYMGKDWSALEPLLNIQGVQDKKTVCYFLKNVEGLPDKTVFEVQDCADEGMVDIQLVETIEKINPSES